MISTISELIALVETGNNLHALRFEPDYQPKPEHIGLVQKRWGCYVSYSTARVVLASSWGKYQIMGFNIYDMGFQHNIAEFWNDSDIQDYYFSLFLRGNDINYTLEAVTSNELVRNRFALKYNGSLEYANKMMEVYNSRNV